MKKTLYQLLKESGTQLDNYYSDLYVLDTTESRKIIDEFKFDNGRKVSNATTFKSQIDGKAWIEVPFMFDPYWEMIGKKKN